jgi:SHS2 domain-containing protein
MGEETYSELEHTADWAIRITAKDLPDLLIKAARGMLDLMGLPRGEGGEKQKIEIDAIDEEDLLVAWLEELLYLVESRSVGFAGLQVEVSEGPQLVATVETVAGLEPEKEIKAVTFHNLDIHPVEGGLGVTIVFDV